MVAMWNVGTPLGDRIVALREGFGWSQGMLALRAGVEQTWLSNVEVGRTKKPDPEYLVRVARALSTSVEYLVTGEHQGEAVTITGPEHQASRLRRLARYPEQILERLELTLGLWVTEVKLSSGDTYYHTAGEHEAAEDEQPPATRHESHG